MPSYKYTASKSSSHIITGRIERAACFGSFFQSLGDVSFIVYYDVNTQAQKSVQGDGSTSRFDKDTIKRHVDLLRRCGFVFDFKIGEEKLDHMTAAGPVYELTVTAGKNSPIMTKFLLNAFRWQHQNTGCLRAFHKMCEEEAPATELETFNIMLISSLADVRSTSHNIGIAAGFIVPVDDKKFAVFKKDKSGATAMTTSLTVVQDKLALTARPKNAYGYSSYDSDLTWLSESGGFKKYMAELEQNQRAESGDGLLQALRGALGITQANSHVEEGNEVAPMQVIEA